MCLHCNKGSGSEKLWWKNFSSKFLTPIWHFSKIFEEFWYYRESFHVLTTDWNTTLEVFHSLDDVKYLRIHSMNIKKFFKKKKFSSKFLTQIWSFQRSQYDAISPLANFECQKKFFWDLTVVVYFSYPPRTFTCPRNFCQSAGGIAKLVGLCTFRSPPLSHVQ